MKFDLVVDDYDENYGIYIDGKLKETLMYPSPEEILTAFGMDFNVTKLPYDWEDEFPVDLNDLNDLNNIKALIEEKKRNNRMKQLRNELAALENQNTQVEVAQMGDTTKDIFA